MTDCHWQYEKSWRCVKLAPIRIIHVLNSSSKLGLFIHIINANLFIWVWHYISNGVNNIIDIDLTTTLKSTACIIRTLMWIVTDFFTWAKPLLGLNRSNDMNKQFYAQLMLLDCLRGHWHSWLSSTQDLKLVSGKPVINYYIGTRSTAQFFLKKDFQRVSPVHG